MLSASENLSVICFLTFSFLNLNIASSKTSLIFSIIFLLYAEKYILLGRKIENVCQFLDDIIVLIEETKEVKYKVSTKFRKCGIDIQEFNPFWVLSYHFFFFFKPGRQWLMGWFSIFLWTEQRKHGKYHLSGISTKHIFVPQQFSPIYIWASQFRGWRTMQLKGKKVNKEERGSHGLLFILPSRLWQASPSVSSLLSVKDKVHSVP